MADLFIARVRCRYKLEGKYHIPVNYKAILKLGDGEVVVVTRQVKNKDSSILVRKALSGLLRPGVST